jgi:hypothetical protein
MALAVCRECFHDVSTEAASCPHCGVSSPTSQGPQPKPGIDRRNPLTYLAIITAVVVLTGGYFAYDRLLAGYQADGGQIETTIVDRFQTINPKATLTANCPSTVRLRKDKIVDCSLERTDNGKQTAVYVTGVDNAGHFQMQLGDPSVLIDFP